MSEHVLDDCNALTYSDSNRKTHPIPNTLLTSDSGVPNFPKLTIHHSHPLHGVIGQLYECEKGAGV